MRKSPECTGQGAWATNEARVEACVSGSVSRSVLDSTIEANAWARLSLFCIEKFFVTFTCYITANVL